MVMEHEKYEKHESNQEHHDIIYHLLLVYDFHIFTITIHLCCLLKPGAIKKNLSCHQASVFPMIGTRLEPRRV